MASTALGIPLGKVHVISVQDTDITPFGLGAYGSRQTYVGGMSVSRTAGIMKEKILKAASGILQMQIETLDLVNGNIILKTNNEILLSLGELATETLYSTEASEHITAEATTQAKSNAFSFGCCFAEVEVDIPLAKIKLLDIINAHDAGNLINPQLAACQVHGGMSMAIGFGLSEQMLYDEKTGRLLNGNLLDYKLCTIMDHPHLEAQFVEHFEPTTPFGTKALGEPPTVPGAPAIRNAVLHATGVALNKIPMTPQNIFPAFKAAGLL
jgi:xanthine dehydrogenase molybdenum-binding subunit